MRGPGCRSGGATPMDIIHKDDDAYPWIKWIHVLSGALLFGTGLGTAFHMYATHLRGNVAAIAVAARNTTLADWLFIATSGVVQPVSGLFLIRIVGFDSLESWLVATYVLYGVAALCWIRVVGLQYRIRTLAETASANGSPLPADYFAAMRLWFILGWPAFIALVLIYALMVLKPTLW